MSPTANARPSSCDALHEPISLLAAGCLPPEEQAAVRSHLDGVPDLRHTTRVATCDWNLDHEAGAQCLVVHLDKARAIFKADLPRARLECAAGKTDDAVADAIARLKLARDCGGKPNDAADPR